MKKRLLALILTIIMAVSVFPMDAFAFLPGGKTEYITLGQDMTGTIVNQEKPDLSFEAWYGVDYKLTLSERTYLPLVVYFIGLDPSISIKAFNVINIKIYDSHFKELYTTGQDSWGYFPNRFDLGSGVTLDPGTYWFQVTGGDLPFSKIKGVSYEITTCNHSNITTEVVTEPTCSQYGQETSTCGKCGNVASTKTLEKLPHTPGEWEVTKEPDECRKDGERVKYCEVCGEVAERETIKAADHSPNGEWEIVREPTTCNGGAGLRVQRCTVCDKYAKEEKIAAPDHTFGKWETIKQATCTLEGKEIRTCKVCGYQDDRFTKLADHEYGEWKEFVAATCDHEGIQTRSCKNCSAKEEEKIPMQEHSFSEWKVYNKAYCTGPGLETRECRVCKKLETREIPATRHDYGEPAIYLGTALQSKCTICGNKISLSQYYEWLERKKNEVTVTRANSTTPTVIVLVVPAFTDVNSSSWYQSVVTYAYNLGLMVGNSDTTFNPMGNVTVAEAVTMAARARNSYNGGTNNDFKASSVWYQTYVDYAIENGIIKKGDFDRYDRVATRAEMAYIFAHALPDKGMKAINKVTSLPDVDSNTKYSKEIFTLYNAGILTGSDTKGTFLPDNPITRSEAAAIITRITLSSERKTLNLK